MSDPERVRIQVLVAEGYWPMRHLIGENLHLRDIPFTAVGSLPELQVAIDDLGNDFGVAVISGHLPNRDQGEMGANYIRKLRPEVPIIAHSADYHSWGDYYVEKGCSMRPLMETIKQVLNKLNHWHR